MSLLAFVFRRTLRINSPALHHLRFVASSSAPPSPPRRASGLGPGEYPIPPQLTKIQTAEENAQVEEWMDQFVSWYMPRNLVEVSYSRSSGPGGQNVNKVNTKVTIRCPVNSEWIPPWVREHLRTRSGYYVASDDTLLMHCQTHRSQVTNLKSCIRKLQRIIIAAVDHTRSRPPSREKQERVRNLQERSDARRREDKNRRSEVKNSRSSRDWD
ncbi:CsMn35 [Gelatoporia subvermispora B]|uniref:CsMn35 n=1 Tax=Ceriporiopsis subvermispora (strain B) TaxID=914234 RepID=M2QXN5_CERS8|nr:CsMn35 [Gelatoporia subvermispora B]